MLGIVQHLPELLEIVENGVLVRAHLRGNLGGHVRFKCKFMHQQTCTDSLEVEEAATDDVDDVGGALLSSASSPAIHFGQRR